MEGFNVLNRIKNEHPHMLATSENFDGCVFKIIHNEQIKKWYEMVKEDAEELLNMETFTADPSSYTFLSTSEKTRERIHKLAFMYRIEKTLNPDLAILFARRAWKEIENACSWENWGDHHFLMTAATLSGVAVGYDWLYDFLDESQRTLIRNAIKIKGLEKALECYLNPDLPEGFWAHPEEKNNWVMICNGAVGVAALAIGNDDPSMKDLIETVLQYTFKQMPRSITQMGQDGDWSEGAFYYAFCMEYLFEYFSALDSSLGTTEVGPEGSEFPTKDLAEYPGCSETWSYPFYILGPIGKVFNYADSCDIEVSPGPMLFYMAKKYNRPYASLIRAKFADLDETWYPWDYNKDQYYAFLAASGTTEKDILWFDPQKYDDSLAMNQLPLDKYYKHTEISLMRSDWDYDGLFVGFKGGEHFLSNHRNLDFGSFVFDALGYRWAEHLDKDNYNLPGYFDGQRTGKRWIYYRKRAEGCNTLVINPDDQPDQNVKAECGIIRTGSGSQEAFAISDLSDAYRGKAESIKRGIRINRKEKSILVQDEIKADNADVYWFMHTVADIEICSDNSSAILKQGNKRLCAKIISPTEAIFTIMSAEPLPSSPSYDKAKALNNSEYKKLTVHLPRMSEGMLAVYIIPFDEENSVLDEFPAITPLNNWCI